MKKKLFTIAVVVLCGAAKAQSVMPQVVSSGGGSGQNAQGSLDWTIGEPVTETVSNGTNTLTQGFQQPTLQLVTTIQNKNDLLNLLVYPNPTADYVILNMNHSKEMQYQFHVYDASGKLVQQGTAGTSNPKISFHGFASGQYTLSLQSSTSSIQNITIIKQN